MAAPLAAQDEGPLAETLNAALTAFQSTSHELFKNLAAPTRSQPVVLPANLLETLVGIDEHLGYLVARADEHAETQTRIDELLRRIRAYDATWRADVREAHRWKKTLDAAVEEGRRDRERIQQTEAAQLEPDAILAYARRIANYTSAPPHARARKTEGQPIDWNSIWRLKGVQFPWPDDAKLMSGWLAETLLGNQANAVGETQAIDAAAPIERERRMPVQAVARPPPPVEEEDEDEFDIDLL